MADPAPFVEALRKESQARTPADFLSTNGRDLDTPGLYSWFVDAPGAAQLSHGLRVPVIPGLVYAGLAGATRWPSGQRSKNTLWSRVTTMHLGGNHNFSTLRLTLGSLLASAVGASEIDEEGLTSWMHNHLRIVAIPYDDPDTLGRLEGAVLEALDPPLNLQGRPSTPRRRRLSELRSQYSTKRR